MSFKMLCHLKRVRASKMKSVSDECYSCLKLDKWKKKFVFWDTKDGQVFLTFLLLFPYEVVISLCLVITLSLLFFTRLGVQYLCLSREKRLQI